MSTTTKTTQSATQQQTQSQNDSFNQRQQYEFDPQDFQRFQQLRGQAAGVLGDYMKNPLASSFFNTQVGMANRQIGQGQQAGVSQLMNNLGPQAQGSPIMQALLAQHQRSGTGMRSNAFQNLLMQAQQVQQWATGQAQGFNPLQTGQSASGTSSSQSNMTGSSSGTSSEKKSGLGTWLPQLIGGGLGALSGGLMGGGKPSAGGPQFPQYGGQGGFGSGFMNSPLGPGLTNDAHNLSAFPLTQRQNPFLMGR